MDCRRLLTRLAASMALLAMGGTIYLLFRTKKTLLHIFFQDMGLGSQINHLRESAWCMSLPSWAINNLPGGLWSASSIICLDALMNHTTTRNRLRWCSIIPIVGATSEVLQGMGILPGIFDPIDILFYLLPLVIYIITKNYYIIHTS